MTGNIQISGQIGVNNIFMGAAGAAVIPVTVTNTANDSSDTPLTTYTFSSLSIGDAAANRKIVVCVDGVNVADGSVSSVTVGGNSASLVVAAPTGGSVAKNRSEIWAVDVAAGTTADVVVTFSVAYFNCGVGVFRVIGAASSATDTGSSVAAPTMTDTLNIPANGIAIGGARSTDAAPPTFTWVGIAENYDTDHAGTDGYTGASAEFESEQVGLNITCTSTGTIGQAMAIASWGTA